MAAEDYFDDYPSPYDYDYPEEPNGDAYYDYVPPRNSLYGHRKNTVPMWNGRPIKGMDTDHIMNCILFCERKFVSAKDNFYKAHGSMNSNFYFDSVSKMFPDYDNLRKEYEKRTKED